MQPSPAASTVTVQCSVGVQSRNLFQPTSVSCFEEVRQGTDNGGRCQCYFDVIYPLKFSNGDKNKE